MDKHLLQKLAHVIVIRNLKFILFYKEHFQSLKTQLGYKTN
jgi:hypothetical protein